MAKLSEKSPLRMIGLMSGTSMDGLDICVADIQLHSNSLSFVIVGSKSIPFPPEIRTAIEMSQSGSTEQVCRTHYDLGEFYAKETGKFLSEKEILEIDAVGMHGQTVSHISGKATLQIGEPSFIAEKLDLPVISDFRSRDISVGGTGAPLMPMVDRWIFQKENESVICLNLGGIANVTHLLPKAIGGDVVGFDTGPGMALLDEAMRQLFGKSYDDGGLLALDGKSDEIAVKEWMKDEFISKLPPKSTGRDYFGVKWFKENIQDLDSWNPQDLLASLSLFTARSVAVNCRRFIDFSHVSQVIVSGGGIHHATLMKMLSDELSPTNVRSSIMFGVDPDIKEALGFAILGVAYFKGIPTNIPSVTGASRQVVLGKLTL